MNQSGQMAGRPRHSRRTGVATLWVLLTLPILLLVLCVVVDIGNLWIARVELENSLEASALAAVNEWGMNATTASVNWTNIARARGTELAAANVVRGLPVSLSMNQGSFDSTTNPNENYLCNAVLGPPADGNLVFGKITQDGVTGALTFDASEAPACGAGPVLLDASGNNLQTANNNEWGIAFQVSPLTPATLRIEQIVLDAQASGGTFQFSGTPTVSTFLSDDLANNAVRDSGSSQADVFGFVDPVSQIQFTISGGGRFLTIDFSPSGMDDGFKPGDRFRFGADVIRPPASQGGDSVAGNVKMTVLFNTGTTATGTLVDTEDLKNNCFDPHLIDPTTGTFVVNPSRVPDLPCPPNAAAQNNGQSYVQISGSGDDLFGVRAQASIPVKSLCCSFFGLPSGTYSVSAKATAMFTCATKKTRLVRIDTYICMPGNGADL